MHPQEGDPCSEEPGRCPHSCPPGTALCLAPCSSSVPDGRSARVSVPFIPNRASPSQLGVRLASLVLLPAMTHLLASSQLSWAQAPALPTARLCLTALTFPLVMLRGGPRLWSSGLYNTLDCLQNRKDKIAKPFSQQLGSGYKQGALETSVPLTVLYSPKVNVW